MTATMDTKRSTKVRTIKTEDGVIRLKAVPCDDDRFAPSHQVHWTNDALGLKNLHGDGLDPCSSDWEAIDEAADKAYHSLTMELRQSQGIAAEAIKEMMSQLDQLDSERDDMEGDMDLRDDEDPPADMIVAIPLTKLVNHPANPDPEEAEIIQMMSWLREGSQDEPITVRPKGTVYEVLAGKTRLAAATRLSWQTLDARIRADLADELLAVRFIGSSNHQRRTESPIRQATMLKHMIDAGVPIHQACEVYGLANAASARNKIGLLKLPEPWRSRVISGEMPETVARSLIPYCEHDKLMKGFDKHYKIEWRREQWQRKDQISRAIQSAINEFTRPVDAGVKRNYGWQLGDHVTYFDVTPELEKDLQIVELPTGKNGKKRRHALNVRKYDSLQIPLIKKRKAEGGKAKKTVAKKLSPAAAKKEAERKRKEADEKLAKKLAEWKLCMLRLGISDAIHNLAGSEQWIVAALLPVVIESVAGIGAYRKAPLAEFILTACGRFDLMPNRLTSAQLDAVLHAVGDDDPITESEWLQKRLLCLLFWPRCDPDPLGETEHTGAIRPDLPWGVNLPEMSSATIARIAKLLGVTIDQQWKLGASRKTEQREMIEVFLALHNRDQLADLAKEVYPTQVGTLDLSDIVRTAKTKADAIIVILDAHVPARRLNLPSSLKDPQTKQAAKKRKTTAIAKGK